MSTEGEAAISTNVEQRLNQLEERVTELEAENERLRDELESEREMRHHLIHAKGSSEEQANLGEVFIAGKPAGSMINTLDGAIDRIDDDFDTLSEEIDDTEDRLFKNDAKLRRRISAVADKADVEIQESDILGEDKIRRVLKHGASDVESNVSAVDERAEAVLQKIGKWGQKVNDANGRRLLITSPTVRDRLEDVRGESLATSQIKRVFTKIEEWGADSPRTVRAGKQDGVHRLKIELDTEANR